MAAGETSDGDPAPAFLADGGEMGVLIRALDWAATPVGPPAAWPPALRVTVRLMLTSRHPMFIFWGDRHICFYNDAYRTTLGPERHPGALGQPAREVWDEIWDVIGPQIAQVMSGGEATWYEDQLIPMTRHGQRENVWWTYGYSPIDDPGGISGVGGVLVICNDVTAEHGAHALRRETEQRVQLALAAADSIGTWDWDLDADLVRSDASFARAYGVDPDRAAAGAPIAEFIRNIHPDDREASARVMTRAIETGEELEAEYRILQQDGSVVWVSARGRCLTDGDGRRRFPGVTVEITQRKQAEQRQALLLRLLEQQRRIEDPAEIMRMAAEEVGRAFGVDRVGFFELSGDDTLDLTIGWTAGRLPLLQASLPTGLLGEGFLAELRLGRTTGIADARTDPLAEGGQFAEFGAVAVIGAPVIRAGRWHAGLYVNHGEVRSWTDAEISLVRDVADQAWDAVERARAVSAQRQLNATLEQRVAERTAELQRTEEALRQSQKMEAVGQLTGGLAHDFNNLLTGISGSLELLQSRVAAGRTGELDRFVRAAQGAAKRAAALTHRLLAFSRRQTLEPRALNPNRLVAGMEELIRRTMGPAITVELVAAGGLWNTLADPNQLENALLNLCINARDAMPGGGKLVVETGNRWLDDRAAQERDLPPGQYISLCVSDDGTGMPPEVVARAFDPFFTTKPIGQGTGLGLSMIYGFVRQSGGQVRIYSEAGQGTMVCLYLPRHRGPAEDLDLPAAPSDAVPRAEPDETVLLVDDEPTVRMLVTEVLQDLGYTAIEAGDAAGGLRVLQSTARVDLLVTDVGLPGGMNGRQLADAGRSVRPGLKVLFITGYAENAVLSHGHLEPGMHVLTKPFAMEALATRIRELIEAR